MACVYVFSFTITCHFGNNNFFFFSIKSHLCVLKLEELFIFIFSLMMARMSDKNL